MLFQLLCFAFYCSTGIGNGVLINLSTFNKHDHNYLFDTSIAALLNTICSTCATLICFSAISNVIISNKMDIKFLDFIEPEKKYSSLEFGYRTYTLFLTLIKDEYLAVMLFFFMISSFSMDSAVRKKNYRSYQNRLFLSSSLKHIFFIFTASTCSKYIGCNDNFISTVEKTSFSIIKWNLFSWFCSCATND